METEEITENTEKNVELNTTSTTPSTEVDTSPQSKEELNEKEQIEEGNLYDNMDNETANAEIDYINFETEEFAEFKDVFKDSKISTADYENFKAKIDEMASVKQFSKDMMEIYGEDAPQVLNDYQKLTNDIFTSEEKEILNNLPSTYKTLMVKMGKALGEKQHKLMEDYGVVQQETQAIPETNGINAEERFSKLTEKLLNGKLTAEEDLKIRQERLELAKYL